MHGSKGLEWDLVAVPGQAHLKFPKNSRDTNGWFSSGALPFEFRGDRDSLPVFDLDSVTTASDFATELKRFKDENRDQHAAEERRIAYVAATRARNSLWLSGASLLPAGKKPSAPGAFLVECAEALGADLEPIPDSGAESRDDTVGVGLRIRSPFDESALKTLQRWSPAQAILTTSSSSVISKPCCQHATRESRDAPLPERLNASSFHEWVTDPVHAQQQQQRPMPQKPWPQARLGTLFHSMAESLLAAPGLGDEIDFEPESFGDAELPGLDVDRLEELRQTFLRSKYTTSRLQPLHTEIEVHLPLGATTVVCKIDAVFADGDRILVVDWKTGRKPVGREQVRLRGLQLALYRAAYAEHAGIDPSLVDVELYYVADDEVVRLEHPMTKDELIAQLDEARLQL